MRLPDNNPWKDLVPNGNRLPSGLIWTVVWLANFFIAFFVFIIAEALHLPQNEVHAQSPGPVLLAMPLMGFASLLTFSVWRHRQKPLGRFNPRMLFPPVLLLCIVLLLHPGAQPDWVVIGLCVAGLYSTLSFLTWWMRTQITPPELPIDTFSIGTPDPFSPLLFSGSPAVPLQSIEGLYLVKDTGQELTFRLSWLSLGCIWLITLFVGSLSVSGIVLFFDSIGHFHFSGLSVIFLAGVVMMSYSTLVMLSLSGPNTLILNLDTMTYTHTTYAPLPISKYARLGYGIPFWVQRVTGSMSDIAGICVREVSTKNGPVYCLHLTWNDSRRIYARLGRSYQAEDARSQMLAVADRIGVPALGLCIE